MPNASQGNIIMATKTAKKKNIKVIVPLLGASLIF